MTWAEYQDCYREALALLKEQGLTAETPFLDAEAGRLCRVSGDPLGDLDVLRRAYGDNVAVQIFGERIVDV